MHAYTQPPTHTLTHSSSRGTCMRTRSPQHTLTHSSSRGTCMRTRGPQHTHLHTHRRAEHACMRTRSPHQTQHVHHITDPMESNPPILYLASRPTPTPAKSQRKNFHRPYCCCHFFITHLKLCIHPCPASHTCTHASTHMYKCHTCTNASHMYTCTHVHMHHTHVHMYKASNSNHHTHLRIPPPSRV